MRCSQMVGADASLQHRASTRQTEAHRRRREKHEQSHCQDEERVHMHTALQPAVYCKLALALAKDAGHFKTEEEQRAECFEHGGEDLPDAYRGLVVAEKDLCCNIVMVKHPVDGTIKFQVVYALLFGYRASVMHYLTWAEFQQAFARRLLVMMWSVYVDDSNIVDFRTAKGSGQRLGRRGFQLLGTPFAPKKSKTMSTSNDHLGVVTNWPKQLVIALSNFGQDRGCMTKARGNDQIPHACLQPIFQFRAIVGSHQQPWHTLSEELGCIHLDRGNTPIAHLTY